MTEIADIQRLSEMARRHDCLLVVDNCFCTPALQQPFLLGADVVIHSATKYLDGQGRCIGGAVLGSDELLGENVYPVLKYGGPSMSPFNAWVFLKGLETLGLRMQSHSRNAAEIAEWLRGRPGIEKVYYPGLDRSSATRTGAAPAEGLRRHRQLCRQRRERNGMAAYRQHRNCSPSPRISATARVPLPIRPPPPTTG